MLYAAVPHDTLRTTAAGVTTQVVDYLNATNYYRGATNVTGYILNADPLGNGTYDNLTVTNYINLGGVDRNTWPSGGGVPYDQSLNTTDDVTFDNVTASDTITLGGVPRSTWPSGGGVPYDQSLNTTDDVDFNSVNATTWVNASDVNADDYWLDGATNLTAWVETEIAASGHNHDQNLNTTDDVTFDNVTASDTITLGGVPRSTWPSGGGGGNYTPYEYTVRCRIVGANYEAVAYDGSLLYNNTNAYTCLQTACNYVTSNAAGNPVWRRGRVLNDTVILIGFGEWNIGANELAVPSRVVLRGMGREATTIKGSHASNVIENMWSNCTWGAAIYDLRVDGSGNAIPIRWDMTNGTLPSKETYGWGLLDLQRLHLTGYDTYSLYWNIDSGNNAVLHINDVRAQGIWMLDRMFDSTVTMFQCSELYIKDSSASLIDHFYIGGGHNYGLRVYDGSAQNDNYDLTFTNGIIDNPLETCVIVEDYAENLIFDGITFSNLNWDSANNTFSAFIIEGTAHHINVKDCQFVNDLVYQHASTWKYLIEEKAGSHNNTYLGNTYADNSYRGLEVWDRATGAIYEDAGNKASYWETPYGTSHGTAEASNDDWIAHHIDPSLAVDMGNLTITLTVQESDAAYAAQVKAVNATHFQLYLYDIIATAVEEVDKTIDWTAKYEP